MKMIQRVLGSLCAAPLLLVVASATTANLTVTVDTTNPNRGTQVSAQFLGLFDSANSNYDVNQNTYHTSLFNLMKQMGVSHFRSGDGGSTDAFFNFIGSLGFSSSSVDWGAWGYNVDKDLLNAANIQHIVTTPYDLGFVDAFYFGNEVDWDFNEAKDQYITWTGHVPAGHTYSKALSYSGPDCATPSPSTSNPDPSGSAPYGGGYRGRWEYLRDQAIAAAQAVNYTGPMYFSGCETGNIPHQNDPTGSLTAVNGVPWMLKFAQDEHTKLKLATQHLYIGDASNGYSRDWSSSENYCYLDTVYYGSPKLLYRCRNNNVSGGSGPATDTTNWKLMEPVWVVNTNYNVGDVVQDPKSSPANQLFQCVVAGPSTIHPAATTDNRWVVGDRSQYAFPGPHQIAQQLMSPQNLSDWTTANNNSLLGCSSWPATNSQGLALPFRFEEFSPVSGPFNGYYDGTYADGSAVSKVANGTPSHANCYATALCGLEMMHWWARHGCSGVDPIAPSWQRNSPIYQSNPYAPSPSDFQALPYAYAFTAFVLSGNPGTGTELWGTQPGVTIADGGYNVTAYANLTPNHVYVTIINKTFDSDDLSGSVTANVTIPTPIGFNPVHVHSITLGSGGTAGDSTVSSAQLGGATISTANSSFPVNWGSAMNWSGSSFTITVYPLSAKILDISNF